MNFTAKRPESAQVSLLGEHDRVEHAPKHTPSPASQRWTTRAQVEQLLAHPRIQELWPTCEYVAADPCAGTGQLMRHVDELLGIREDAPWRWLATELAVKLARGRYQRAEWTYRDSARLPTYRDTELVITNLPWFGVFARLVGHWRTVAFPHALIVALCDDQERTRKSAIDWMDAGNYPDIVAALPGRQSFDGADDGQYPFSCSWYVWLPGSRRTRTDGSELIWL